MKTNPNTILCSPDFLKENKKGRITYTQAQWIEGLIDTGFGLMVFSYSVLFPLLSLLPAYIVFKRNQSTMQVFDHYLWWVFGFFCLAFPLGLAIGYSKRRAIKMDLNAGLVAQGFGEVRLSGKALHALIEGRELKAIEGAYKINLPPGRYQFFFLPRSRYLLSADKLDRNDKTNEELITLLNQAYHVDRATLQQNQAQKLSAKQRIRTLNDLLLQLCSVILFIFLICAVLYFIPVNQLSFNQPQNINPKLFWAGLSTAGLTLIAILGFGFLSALRACKLFFDLINSRVAAIEGILEKGWDSETNANYFWFKIGTEHFEVSRFVHDVGVEGIKYRAYYLPKSKKLVGIEPLEQAALTSDLA